MRECLELQLAELEMIRAMFPDEDSLEIDDPSAECDIKEFVDSDKDEIPSDLPCLSFTLKVPVLDDRLTVCMVVHFPSEYPVSELPEIYVKSDKFSRATQATLNADLTNHLSEMDKGDLLIGIVVAWVQDKITEDFLDLEEGLESAREVTSVGDDVFMRIWLYSHHL